MIYSYTGFLNEKKMGFYLPTYNECVEIVKANGELIFYENKYIVNDTPVSVFNYRLANYTNFIQPIEGKNIDAKELRGLTFVHEKSGIKRFLMLQKFWVFEQVPETQYNAVKDKKIKAISNKEDGSLISFIEVNGGVVCKTKMGFTNDQAIAANEIYEENKDIQRFVKDCMKKDYVAMFEYVSFKNKIVLDYPKSDLILLRVRNNKTGEYIDLNSLDKYELPVAKTEELRTLDELIELAETMTEKEGWVIEFEDGYMIKLKTKWYCLRHNLLTDKVNREDNIIEFILDETIDDVVSQLNPESDAEKIAWIERIDTVLKKYISTQMKEVQALVDEYNEILAGLLKVRGEDAVEWANKEAIKQFALKYSRKNNLFGPAVSVIRGNSVYDAVKNILKSKTNTLGSAKTFLQKLGFAG